MTTWTLLAFIFGVWILCCIPALLEKAIQNAKLPEEERGGVTIVPVIPLFPLALWGVAILINRFISRWGTRIIGGLHVLLAAIAIVFIVRYSIQWQRKEY